MNPIYWLLSKIHSFVALVVGGLCEFLYRLQAMVPMRVKLCIGFLLLGATSFAVSFASLPWVSWVAGKLMFLTEIVDLLVLTEFPPQYAMLLVVSKVIGFVCCGVAIASLLPMRAVMYAQRLTWFAFAVMWLWLFTFVYSVPAWFNDFDYKLFDQQSRNDAWIMFGWPWLLLGTIPLLLGFALLLRSAREAYGCQSETSSWVDRLHDNILAGEGDRRYRSSVYWSAFLFFAILVVPFLYFLLDFGMEEPYNLVKGKGEETVQMQVKIKKIKKKKKKYVVNPWSPFIFEQPKIDDSNIAEELEVATSDQYAANTGKSNLGRGGKGKGGWPEGVEGAKFRFIRLKYAGGNWDENMGRGADYNMLLRFNEITGFKIADDTEAIEINRLDNFPEHHAPPFVFMAGKQGWNLSSTDKKVLRNYCLKEGGCLFIDIGSQHFAAAVKNNMRKIFPDKEFVSISDDDPIFKAPFPFPTGVPAPWPHDGKEARGIKHNGRWVVFYSPGNIGDAWRTGHSGAPRGVAEQAYRMGINVMNYSFNQYYRIHFEK